MLKQSVSRNQRSKGFKVKNVVKICVLIVVCVWLLYQLKHSYDKNNKSYYDDDDDDKKLTENVPGTGNNVLKLGRKGGIVDPRVDGRAFVDEKRVEGEEEDEDDDEESRVERNEDEGRGGGEDELDGHDQDGAEEEEYGGVEDLIDEADKESEEKEVEMNLQEDDASSAVDHGTRTRGVGTETISLRKVKVEENSEKSESEQRNETKWVLTKWWEKEKKMK